MTPMRRKTDGLKPAESVQRLVAEAAAEEREACAKQLEAHVALLRESARDSEEEGAFDTGARLRFASDVLAGQATRIRTRGKAGGA
jgi:hypothetical protein